MEKRKILCYVSVISSLNIFFNSVWSDPWVNADVMLFANQLTCLSNIYSINSYSEFWRVIFVQNFRTDSRAEIIFCYFLVLLLSKQVAKQTRKEDV